MQMKLLKRTCFGVLAALPLLFASATAQLPAEWHDDLVDHMAGNWKVSGEILGQASHHEVHAEWALNHQFVVMHEKTAADAPPGERPYEAIWFLSYDTISERYVIHLLDVFGARYSETLGYGTRDGNALRFIFEYPDGPFHTTFLWNRDADSWEWRMEQKDKNGKWSPFGDLKLTRTPR